MTTAVRHPGLILGAARFFHDPRGSMRGMLESRPGEGRLLLYALTAAAVLLVGRALVVTARAVEQGVDPLGLIAAQIVTMLFFVPLLYYGLAAVGTLVARAFGGGGGWRQGRAAFFWAALVSSPVVVLSALASAAAAGAPPALAPAIAQLGPLFFAWALAQCFAETFGFRRAWPVFAVIAGLVLALVAGLWALRP